MFVLTSFFATLLPQSIFIYASVVNCVSQKVSLRNTAFIMQEEDTTVEEVPHSTHVAFSTYQTESSAL